MVLSFTLLSELTKGWPLYLGLVFILMVMFAPGGIASLVMMNVRLAAYRKLSRVAAWYPALLAAALVMLAGAAALIELFYQIQLGSGNETHTSVFGIGLDTQSQASWIGGVAVLLVGYALFELVRRRFGRVWGQVQEEIEAQVAAREGR
jgi:branched-chain amino acid transport system permease protein